MQPGFEVAVAIKPEPSKTNLSLNYADEQIGFERLPRTGSSNKILIKVLPDCRVQISAPEAATDAQVIAAAKLRARWIYQQLREFRSRLEHVRPRQYISGESHYYLGKQYVLKVIENPAEKPAVKLLRGKIEVTVKEKSADKISALLFDWYTARAKEVFARRRDAMLEQALWVSGKPPLRVLTMQTQWGSCSPAGRLTLNPHLVKAPRDCIDYVILHELCHLAEHNHSERFYRLMGQVMPDWEKVKLRLDGMANALIH
ncbi:metal-dependent hydrolase [Chromobacterium sphagni]|uniref:Metal-dependent hydrolase n=1 Tax=Chromobacterium sphagni TaxID=1903179 RepID=A0A1S1X226_9NEIS|nr:metal-dependent hydrolase [Chromobacterium sphagni]